jgi:glycosyltransferase involved in cell wall biosynthesis
MRYYLVAHGIEVWRRFSLLEKVALRGAERIFCVSEFTRAEMLRHYALPPDKLVVVPNALDPYFEIRPGLPLAECQPDILMVTRLSYGDRYKGVEDMIRAMPAVRAALPQARLRIVGQGDDQKRLRSLAARTGLLPHGVEFLGFLDDRRLAQDLGRCRLLALPSRLEGFGLVLLEAMANGRPCLGAASGGIPEVLSKETGILVEPGNAASIARGCIEGLQRTWDQAAILARARHFGYDKFRERLSQALGSRTNPNA